MAMIAERDRCKKLISLVGHSRPSRCGGHIKSTVLPLNVAGKRFFQVKIACTDCGPIEDELCVPIEEEVPEIKGDFSREEASFVLIQIKKEMMVNGARAEVTRIDDILTGLKTKQVTPQEAINMAYEIRDDFDPCW